jgi:dTDP-4-amino-4,6-dideoxy-D-galactose acyltransferase
VAEQAVQDIRTEDGTVAARVTPLPWDSDFFGVAIGRIELEGVDATAIAEAEDRARAAGLVCLYATVDPVDAVATHTLQTLGYRFVEAAQTFDLQLSEPPIPRPDGVEFRQGTVADVPRVIDIVEAMAPWSRFAVDPRFGIEASVRLQRAWLDRAVDEAEEDHSIVVAESQEDGGIVAFIGRVRTPTPRVDAVGTTRRGSGAARHLIETARKWAGDQPLLGGPIAARNVNALRYVSHCAYRVCRTDYLYHRWLDEG